MQIRGRVTALIRQGRHSSVSVGGEHMRKRFLLGGLMVLAGLGLLTPPAWALCSPFLSYAVENSGETFSAWLAATLGGSALLLLGVRRIVTPAPARS
jgi:hypothetical protein